MGAHLFLPGRLMNLPFPGTQCLLGSLWEPTNFPPLLPSPANSFHYFPSYPLARNCPMTPPSYIGGWEMESSGSRSPETGFSVFIVISSRCSKQLQLWHLQAMETTKVTLTNQNAEMWNTVSIDIFTKHSHT